MYRKFFKLYIYHTCGIYTPYIYHIYHILYIYKHTNNCTHAKIPGKGNMYIHTDTHTGHLAWWTSIKPTSWFCPLLPSQAILIHETGFELKRTKSKRKVVLARVKSSDWQYGFLKCKLCILFVFCFFLLYFFLLTVTGDIFKSMVLENVKLCY